MPTFSADIRGLSKTVNKLRKFARELPSAVDETTLSFAQIMLREVRNNLSGKPGMPQKVTGLYQASWAILKYAEGAYSVFTMAPQNFRLEGGFVGIDSAGRHYMQAALPHVAPALATARVKARPLYVKMIKGLLA